MKKINRLYSRAARRVRQLFPEDEEAQEFCLADWPEGDEHLQWLLAAEPDEIRSWVAAGSN